MIKSSIWSAIYDDDIFSMNETIAGLIFILSSVLTWRKKKQSEYIQEILKVIFCSLQFLSFQTLDTFY